MHGVGHDTAAVSSEIAQFTIKPYFQSTFSFEVRALVLPRISAYSPQTL